MRILSADDKAENLYMLEALLRGHGHEVDSASDGLEALRLAQSGAYDFIVSDILMPRMDGFQLCRELKKDPRLRGIPFVFYTATYTDPKDAAFALSLGADRFLIKPMEPDQFLAATAAVMAEAAHRTPQSASSEDHVPEDESIYLKEYNARLVSKLEKKMLDLEAANRALREDVAARERHSAERARLERQLRQAQKLEAIGTLAGGIAHDFNNILGVISGFAEVGEMECEEGDTNAQIFAQILRATERGRDITQQVMAFSSQADASREVLDVEEAVKEAIGLTSVTLPPTIEVRADFASPLAPILGNATQIHRILANMIQNACHAIGNRAGHILVKASNFEVTKDFAADNPTLQVGRYVLLTVADDGGGMDTATLDRIFDPFFTAKAFGQGTGLGLSIVHGIMKAYEGAITVTSEPNRGTAFHLYFPVRETALEPATETANAAPRGHGERVLVIDDDDAIARFTSRALERLGYTPEAFCKAEDALSALAAQPFDLVITDLTMGQFTGLEIARKVWDVRPETPVILITGYSATLDQAKARSLGFRDLLCKPYTAQELAECVRQSLAQPVPA